MPSNATSNRFRRRTCASAGVQPGLHRAPHQAPHRRRPAGKADRPRSAKAVLNGEEKKRFLDFADAWSTFNGDSTLDGFITGFRLGARFVLDAFVLPEASPQNYLQDKE